MSFDLEETRGDDFLSTVRYEPLHQHIAAAVETLHTFLINLKQATGTLRPGEKLPRVYTAETLSRQLSEGTIKGCVAFHENKVAGLIAYSLMADLALPNPDLLYISALWVTSAHRNHGLAKNLVNQACLMEKRPAMLVCDQRNKAAVEFYKKLGAKTSQNARLVIYSP